MEDEKFINILKKFIINVKKYINGINIINWSKFNKTYI